MKIILILIALVFVAGGVISFSNKDLESSEESEKYVKAGTTLVVIGVIIAILALFVSCDTSGKASQTDTSSVTTTESSATSSTMSAAESSEVVSTASAAESSEAVSEASEAEVVSGGSVALDSDFFMDSWEITEVKNPDGKVLDVSLNDCYVSLTGDSKYIVKLPKNIERLGFSKNAFTGTWELSSDGELLFSENEDGKIKAEYTYNDGDEKAFMTLRFNGVVVKCELVL